MQSKKILILEPYYGGSHKHFLDGLIKHLDVSYCLLTLPARKWKMRMQLASPWFVKKLGEFPVKERCFDVVLTSTFLDVAVFKALVEVLDGWNRNCQIISYFHENQFNYPDNQPKKNNHQFTAINFTTALVADKIGFNSLYNMSGFLAQCKKYLSKASDIDLGDETDLITKKSRVIYPGLDYSGFDCLPIKKKKNKIPLIIWNHRWEHDKNPEEFITACYRLKEEGVPFNLAILGQQFKMIPECFTEAEIQLRDHIIHSGYLENKEDYYHMLRNGDIVVSTALHEFFGIAVIEAVRAGCYPVLPDRLSYPELFDKKYLYETDELYQKLKNTLLKRLELDIKVCNQMTERFNWKVCVSLYRDWLEL